MIPELPLIPKGNEGEGSDAIAPNALIRASDSSDADGGKLYGGMVNDGKEEWLGES